MYDAAGLRGECSNSPNRNRRRNRPRLDLSTSELQSEALAFYENAGYARMREEVAVVASNKTIGSGIRRYHFTKVL